MTLRLAPSLQIELAGLIDMETGLLERDVPAKGWSAPTDIHLSEDGERLIWRYVSPERQVNPDDGLLSQFVALSDTPARPPEAFLEYARRWGPLQICKHHVPFTHNFRSFWDLDDEDPFCYPVGFKPAALSDPELAATLECSDSIEDWRRLSFHIRGVLGVAAALQEDELPKAEHWRGLLIQRRENQSMSKELLIVPQRLAVIARRLQLAIDRLLEIGDVRPRLISQNGEWEIEFGGTAAYASGSPFSGIALHTLFSVASSTGVAVCTSCGSPYIPPKRRPKKGQRRFCVPCRTAQVYNRHSKRAARRRTASE